MGQIFFSVLMCVYNKAELLENAINSVLGQSEDSWELLILDNSDVNRDYTWEILQTISRNDGRIKIFRNNENVGWAKGASVLLQKASGKYMTFLAADDFLLPLAFAKVKKDAEEHEPDVLWVGNAYYEFEQGNLVERGVSVPFQKKVIDRRYSENIRYVMEHTFYNSFFHYVKVEFLKNHNIDFFESGYGDCAGMTKVLSQAERMVVLNEAVYGLTVNTTQSRGTFYWDGDQYIFSVQWNSIKEAYVRDAYFSFQDLRYCAWAILKNEIGNIYSMAEGAKCVNRFMNPFPRNIQERMRQIKQVLENDAIQEMAQFMGRFEYESEMLTALEKIFELCPQEERPSLIQQSGWLGKFLKAGYCLTVHGLQKRRCIGIREIETYMQALTDPDNSGVFGIGIFLQIADKMEEDVFAEGRKYLEAILETYNGWKDGFVNRIWNGIGNGGKLSGNGKVELAAFCKYILDN